MPATPRIWVNKNDIDHRQEGGETGDHFGACRCAVLAQFKHALKQTLTRCLGSVLLTHHQFPNKEGKFVAILYQNATIGAVIGILFSLNLLIRQRLRLVNCTT
jgi:hypothetical protein